MKIFQEDTKAILDFNETYWTVNEVYSMCRIAHLRYPSWTNFTGRETMVTFNRNKIERTTNEDLFRNYEQVLLPFENPFSKERKFSSMAVNHWSFMCWSIIISLFCSTRDDSYPTCQGFQQISFQRFRNANINSNIFVETVHGWPVQTLDLWLIILLLPMKSIDSIVYFRI